MKIIKLRTFVALLVLLLISLSSACSRGEDYDDDDAPETTAAAYKPTGDEGSISGVINFTGTAPAQKPIDMNADPVCAQRNPNAVTEDVVIKDGKMQYTFVYIKGGTDSAGKSITGYSFTPSSEPKELDQVGCHYVPHVVGIQTNQKLLVKNSDPTNHNVNVQAKSNPSFNQGQGPGAANIEKTFPRPETLIPVKCNQHPWMKAYIGVLAHPFYAVSGEDGSFRISGVPPGKYTVVAWHERYGEKTMEVTVSEKADAKTDFSFDESSASDTLRGGSLQVMPALELPMLKGH